MQRTSYDTSNFVTSPENVFFQRRDMAKLAGHEWVLPFRELMNVQKNYLKCSGLWIIDPEHSSFLRSAYFVYKGWMLSAMYISAITLFSDIYDNIDNLSITTDDGCIFAGMLVVIFKAMNYQIRRNKIARFVSETLKCADDLCEFSNAKYAKRIVEKYQVRNKVVFYGFTLLGCVLGIALLFCSPMENGLPIRTKYPFDTTKPLWHKIALFIETCAICGGLVAIIAMDSITTMTSSVITMLLDILNLNFENCNNRALNDEDEIHMELSCNVQPHPRKTNNIFLHRYKQCLRFHQRLVSLSKEYNNIYSSSMFVQMLSSTSIICLTGFQAVVVGGQSSDILKFGIYLSAAVSQLLYICWIGNELSYSSSVLDRGQWLSDWHHQHLPSIVRMFTLSTMFTRQSITLKAGVFYVLSLETFITIVRRSYSVYTLLNNMQSTDL